MNFFSHDSDEHQAYRQVQDTNEITEEHKASWSHELIAGAAAFEAAKSYEEHCQKNGQPESHSKAKELMAGFAAAAADRLIETKGLDFIDREKAKRQAEKKAEQAVNEDNYASFN